MRDLPWGQLNFLQTTDTHGWHAGHLQEAQYSADWGDYISFATRMREKADKDGVDLLLIDTGDRIEGNGLYDASSPKGQYTYDIFKEQDIDVICTGNHELYEIDAAAREYDQTVPNFKDRYLASNLDYIKRTGEIVPMAQRYRTFTTKNQGIRVLAFGFLFDFKGNGNNTVVQPVEETIKEEWFQQAIREDVDLFLVAGHVMPRGPEYKAIYKAIRSQKWDTPIQFFGGHSHIRDFTKYDSKAYGLQSGRYMETIGWMSIDGIKGQGKQELEVVNQELEPSTKSKEEALTKKRKELMYLQHKIQKALLNREFAPKPEDMDQISGYISKIESYASIELSVIQGTKIHKVLKSVFKLDNIPRDAEFHIKSRCQALYDKFHEAISLGGDYVAIQANMNFQRRYIDNNLFGFYHHTGLDSTTFPTEHGKRVSTHIRKARSALKLDHTYGCAPKDLWLNRAPYPSNDSILTWLENDVLPAIVTNKERKDVPRLAIANTGAMRFDIFKGPFTRDTTFIVSPFLSKFQYIKDVPYSSAKSVIGLINNGGPIFSGGNLDMSLLSVPEQISIQQDIIAPQISLDEKSSSFSNQRPLSKEPDLIPGYTTTDDLGKDGDDTVHSPISFYRVPNCIQAPIAFPSSDPEIVDLVFIDFTQPWVLLALKFLGESYEKIHVKNYTDETFTELISAWIQENWKQDCGDKEEEEGWEII
ncbi:hypothetical protein B7494_g7155 [Chlorociboria aeruginascens]|nr:hypothetical protein B7494_g7155 [Chlorociboria aeruginascens]